jgi:hypothetical protein
LAWGDAMTSVTQGFVTYLKAGIAFFSPGKNYAF